MKWLRIIAWGEKNWWVVVIAVLVVLLDFILVYYFGWNLYKTADLTLKVLGGALAFWSINIVKKRNRRRVIGKFYKKYEHAIWIAAVFFALIYVAFDYSQYLQSLFGYDEKKEYVDFALKVLGGCLGFVALYYTIQRWHSFEKQVRIQERGQVSERIKTGLELLSNDKEPIRMGAVDFFDKLARDARQAGDANTVHEVMDMLCSYIVSVTKSQKYHKTHGSKPSNTVQKILDTLFRTSQPPPYEGFIADLRGAYLYRANLQGARFRGTWLTKTHFEKADLRGADLKKALVIETHFEKADLSGAWFIDNFSIHADFSEADVYGTRFSWESKAQVQDIKDLLQNAKNADKVIWVNQKGQEVNVAGERIEPKQ